MDVDALRPSHLTSSYLTLPHHGQGLVWTSMKHHALHRRYRDLYERALERHLKTTLGATPQALYAALERDAADGDSERRSTALAFLAVVRKADDYALFAASMRGATKHARGLEEPD